MGTTGDWEYGSTTIKVDAAVAGGTGDIELLSYVHNTLGFSDRRYTYSLPLYMMDGTKYNDVDDRTLPTPKPHGYPQP